MIHIRVPASCANLGPGFDSIGVALNLYLEVQAEPSEAWYFEATSDSVKGMPKDHENVIYQAAQFVATKQGHEHLPPYRVEVASEIPVARGLGSSASAIVAGIELADHILDLHLSETEKVSYASQIEGHPDNVVPSVTGSGVIAYQEGEDVSWTTVPFQDVCFLAAIPSFDLKTSEARDVLPSKLSYKEAVDGSAVANVLVAALAKGDWALAGKMMEKDRYHQPYRGALMPHYDELRNYLNRQGVYGTFMSGAGPTIMSLIPTEQGAFITESSQRAYPNFEWKRLSVDYSGSVVTAEKIETKS
ncbi:homoserine kinase [Pontibacillus salipaludis]|uniref:Homoserine kinase n=1 Tax=Pontibacillus salipaludis TaxID=1697394 RepID=A0ABQ1Q9V3_9BACI|nr:homoserine kinase [Pontibacillus salipaludis]GGD18398.1 homoserine kinase [Pontibacillus salipaludis]